MFSSLIGGIRRAPFYDQATKCSLHGYKILTWLEEERLQMLDEWSSTNRDSEARGSVRSGGSPDDCIRRMFLNPRDVPKSAFLPGECAQRYSSFVRAEW